MRHCTSGIFFGLTILVLPPLCGGATNGFENALIELEEQAASNVLAAVTTDDVEPLRAATWAFGQFLTKMIEAMGYTRDDVFIANICKCRPSNNRTPTADEMRVCLPFLREQIRIVQPKTIVLLGGTAIRGLLATQAGVSRLQGNWTSYEGIPVMPTYHPAYILRFESAGDATGLKRAKTEVWRALKLVLAQLGRTPPPVRAKK